MADKTVRIGVDAQEAQGFQSRMRQSAESLARDMIRSARSYSTSSKEVLKDIEDQIQAIEKRNRLDAEFRKTRLENLRGEGKVSGGQYAQSKDQIQRESREDQLQTKLLREIIDAIKRSSKEEIREDRKNVYQRISGSKTVGALGVSGDEEEAIKETIQQDLISDTSLQEARQRRGFNIGGAVSRGQQVASGDIGGAAMGGGMGMLRSAFSNPYTAIGAVALIAAGGTMMSNKAMGENLRGYGVSTQMPLSEMIKFRKSIRGGDYTEFGMTGNELLSASTPYIKALGGRDFTGDQLTGLTAITKARDISPDLLSQTLGFSRYSNGGGLTTVISNLEDSIRKMYGGDDFKRKLIQLPEMMQVYNSLASQMLSSIGEVDQGALSNYVGGVGQTFGVEGQNLGRYSTGLKRMFGRTGNKFVSSIQNEVIRRRFPNLSGTDLYQKMLEVQEDPTSNPWYMEGMWDRMQEVGGSNGRMNQHWRSWLGMGNFGAKEARKMYGVEYDPTKFNTQEIDQDQQEFKRYTESASGYYARMEDTAADAKEFFEKVKITLGKILEKSEDIDKNINASPNANQNNNTVNPKP